MSRRLFFYGLLLVVVAIWSFARLHGMGLFCGDSIDRHLDALRMLDGRIDLHAFWEMIWIPAMGYGRFPMVLQLPHCYIMYLPSPQYWWTGACLSAFLVLLFFSLGVGRQAGGKVGALAFLMIMAGLTINNESHPFTLWPIFLWGLGTLGIGLLLDVQEAGRRRHLFAAVAYFLAPCCGNEGLLAPVIGMVVGRFWVEKLRERRSWPAALRACAPPLWGGGIFLVADELFRLRFPSHYDGSQIDLSHPMRSFYAWIHATLSGLPGWDFGRLEVSQGASFNHLIGDLVREGRWIVFLTAFAIFCACVTWALMREDRMPVSSAGKGQEEALGIALGIGFLLNMAPLILSAKYAFFFTSRAHGFYMNYSFNAYAYACVLLVLACQWVARKGRPKAAAVVLVALVGANALTSGLSSQYYMPPIRWEVARWKLWDRFVEGSAAFLPSSGNVCVVAPQFYMALYANAAEKEDGGLHEYFLARTSLLRKAGHTAPSPSLNIKFLEKVPSVRLPGDRYYFLKADRTLDSQFGDTVMLRCAEIAPDWQGNGEATLCGPIWVWFNNSRVWTPHAITISWIDLSSHKLQTVSIPYREKADPARIEAGRFHDADIVLRK